MKVLIVNNMAPFVRGGAEELATHLQKNLILAGHEAEILRIPFQWEPAERIPSQMLMVRGFELSDVDRVIAFKFPAFLIRHPEKTMWILHQYRQAYDLYGTEHSNINDDKSGDDLRRLIKNADNQCLKESRSVFTNSEVTRQRLAHFNNFNAKVLLPPVNNPELFSGGKMENYIFAGGRINNTKRQHLLIEAMRYSDKNLKLLIAGPPDSDADAQLIRKQVALYGLEDRISLDLRFLPQQTYLKYLNAASAVAYIPVDEDSFGYVAMEAATAAKALITTSDSGGILNLVNHEETGWVSEANALSLATAFNAVIKNPLRTQDYGRAARDLWLSFGINWPQTVETLLQ